MTAHPEVMVIQIRVGYEYLAMLWLRERLTGNVPWLLGEPVIVHTFEELYRYGIPGCFPNDRINSASRA
jgi:hypothetical protein